MQQLYSIFWFILLELLVMVLPTRVLRRTMFLWTLSRYMRVTVRTPMETSTKNSLQHHPAVNVWCKGYEKLNTLYQFYSSYTCNKFENYKSGSLLMWNTSVSDRCCQNCDGVVHKADSVIDTIHHEDECQTIETSVCRILPGMSYVSLTPSFTNIIV